jgi:hypothetical protein
MPLTVAQTTAFFEDVAQMGLPHATVIQLQQEGITTAGDLAEFDKTTIEQIAANLRRPAGRILDPNPGADEGATIPTQPFVFNAKSQKRLKDATELIKYYESVGRPLAAGNIQHGTTMRISLSSGRP